MERVNMWFIKSLILFIYLEGIFGEIAVITSTGVIQSVDLFHQNDELPSLAVCCPPGTVMKKLRCTNNVTKPINDIQLPQVYADRMKKSSKSIKEFHLVYNNPCKHGLWALDNQLNPFYLLENGTVYRDNSHERDYLGCRISDVLLDINEYCLVNLEGENGSYTQVGVCNPPDRVPIIFPIAMALSIPFLMATFFVYAFLPELRNIHGMSLMAYVGSLFWAYSGLVLVQMQAITAEATKNLCIFTAFVIHFSYLSAFFWLNVMCFDIWWTFKNLRILKGNDQHKERRKFIIYSVYAWGCASIMTVACIVMDFAPGIPDYFVKPGFGTLRCWFKEDAAKAVYLKAPMGATVICNIIFFLLTILRILQHKKHMTKQLDGDESRIHNDNEQRINLYLKLFIVMGINWTGELFTWLSKDAPAKLVWYVVDTANTLQVVIIFIIFVCKSRIKRLLLKRLEFL